MNHIVVVKVVDSLEDLSDCLRRIFFRELAIFTYSIKEFPAGSQLRNNIVFVLKLPCQYRTMAAPSDIPLTQTSRGIEQYGDASFFAAGPFHRKPSSRCL